MSFRIKWEYMVFVNDSDVFFGKNLDCSQINRKFFGTLAKWTEKKCSYIFFRKYINLSSKHTVCSTCAFTILLSLQCTCKYNLVLNTQYKLKTYILELGHGRLGGNDALVA